MIAMLRRAAALLLILLASACADRLPGAGEVLHGEFGGYESVSSFRTDLLLRPGETAYDWPSARGARNLRDNGVTEQDIADGLIGAVKCVVAPDTVVWWHARVPVELEPDIGAVVEFTSGVPLQDRGPISSLTSILPATAPRATVDASGVRTVRCRP